MYFKFWRTHEKEPGNSIKNFGSLTSLDWGVLYGKKKSANDILMTIAEDSRVDINLIGTEFLFSAIGQTNYEKIDYLLNQGVNPNGQKVINNETYTLLHFAIRNSDRDEEFSIVKRLVRDPSVDLNIKNGENMTPLEYANHLGLEDVVAILEDALK